MKSGKTFTLDLDILLKKPTSKLVNKLLKDFYGKIDDGECPHDWSNWFATESGLARECKLCHKTEFKNRNNTTK